MMEPKIVRVGDVMKREFDVVDGKLTVKEALLAMKHPETRALIVEKRHDDDEYGLVLISDIAKKVLGADRAPDHGSSARRHRDPAAVPARHVRLHHVALQVRKNVEGVRKEVEGG